MTATLWAWRARCWRAQAGARVSARQRAAAPSPALRRARTLGLMPCAPPRAGGHARGDGPYRGRLTAAALQGPVYGQATLCVQASLAVTPCGPDQQQRPHRRGRANKATHFIQWMCQLGQPIIYLQNTTGYMVGKDSEQGGMIKHGSKMIQAVTNATVPQITIQWVPRLARATTACAGAALRHVFVHLAAGHTAVMGAEQAARTMQIVSEAALARKGVAVDAAQSQQQFDQIVAMFAAQSDAFTTSGLGLDDGVIDPRDTRAVLMFCLDTIAQSAQHQPGPCSLAWLGCKPSP